MDMKVVGDKGSVSEVKLAKYIILIAGLLFALITRIDIDLVGVSSAEAWERKCNMKIPNTVGHYRWCENMSNESPGSRPDLSGYNREAVLRRND